MRNKRETRTWAEVDLDALAHNYHALRGLLAPGCRLLAPVKADAYGHGAVPVAKKLEELGADYLAVAYVNEGVELRQAGISLPILCLGPTPEELMPELLKYDITQALDSPENARALSAAAVKADKTLNVHLKIDTGMGRLGFLWNEDRSADLFEVYGRMFCDLFSLPNLHVEGMFTHFAAADEDGAYTMTQLDRFLDLRDKLEKQWGSRPEICHCAASAAVLHYPQSHLDMVRPGIALYGYYTDGNTAGLPELRPILRLKSRVAALRRMPAGAKISYGCTATLKRDSLVAVLPIGYGDGLPRCLSNKLEVRMGDKLCPVLGRICMDLCMVDVTDRPETKVGDTAEIYGPGLTEWAAERADTIPYELLCRISPRVPRVYYECGAKSTEIF